MGYFRWSLKLLELLLSKLFLLLLLQFQLHMEVGLRRNFLIFVIRNTNFLYPVSDTGDILAYGHFIIQMCHQLMRVRVDVTGFTSEFFGSALGII